MAVKKRRSSTRSGLFLTELIIAILFFSLASAICIQLFVKAHTISTNSRDLSVAINQIQTVAESFKSSDGSAQSVRELIGGIGGDTTETENQIFLLFDSNWNEVKSDPAFELSVVLDTQSPINATITVSRIPSVSSPSSKGGVITVSEEKPKELVYELKVKKYIADK